MNVQDFINGQSLANPDSIIAFCPLPTFGEVPVPLPSLTASDQVHPLISHFGAIRSPIPFQVTPFCILRNPIFFYLPSE